MVLRIFCVSDEKVARNSPQVNCKTLWPET